VPGTFQLDEVGFTHPLSFLALPSPSADQSWPQYTCIGDVISQPIGEPAGAVCARLLCAAEAGFFPPQSH
jgi:hypothetical protein